MSGLWALLEAYDIPVPQLVDGDVVWISGKCHIVEGGQPKEILGNRRERRTYLAKRRRAAK